MREKRPTIVMAALALAACGTCSKPEEQPAAPDPERCSGLLEQIRSLRDGPQPCESRDDCTVWHNGAYWDGCPPEVNTTNAARLDELRRTFEQEGCTAVTDQLCPAKGVRGCVSGECGKEPLFKLKLNPAQKKAYDDKVEERQVREKVREDEPASP
jgi:hypothetical protein